MGGGVVKLPIRIDFYDFLFQRFVSVQRREAEFDSSKQRPQGICPADATFFYLGKTTGEFLGIPF